MEFLNLEGIQSTFITYMPALIFGGLLVLLIFAFWLIFRKLRLWYWKVDKHTEALENIAQNVQSIKHELKCVRQHPEPQIILVEAGSIKNAKNGEALPKEEKIEMTGIGASKRERNNERRSPKKPYKWEKSPTTQKWEKKFITEDSGEVVPSAKSEPQTDTQIQSAKQPEPSQNVEVAAEPNLQVEQKSEPNLQLAQKPNLQAEQTPKDLEASAPNEMAEIKEKIEVVAEPNEARVQGDETVIQTEPEDKAKTSTKFVSCDSGTTRSGRTYTRTEIEACIKE